MATLAVTAAPATFRPFADIANLPITLVTPKPDYSVEINRRMLAATDARTARVGVIGGHSLYDVAVRQAEKDSPLAQCQRQIEKLSEIIGRGLKTRGNTVVFAQTANFEKLLSRSEYLFWGNRLKYLQDEATGLQRCFYKLLPNKRTAILPTYKAAIEAMRVLTAAMGTDEDTVLSAEQLQQIAEAVNTATATNKALRNAMR